MEKLIAIGMLWIAHQQWVTSEKERKNKLSKDYYKCYQNLSKAQDKIFKNGIVDSLILNLIEGSCCFARFFLSEDAVGLVEKFLESGRKAHGLDLQLNDLPPGEIRSKIAEEKNDLVDYLIKDTSKLFRKYLANEEYTYKLKKLFLRLYGKSIQFLKKLNF